MIKKFSVLFLTAGSIFAFSQIGINTTTPDPSAALDIQNRCILMINQH